MGWRSRCNVSRNDIDRVGVPPGCLLTMWTEDNFAGLSLSYSTYSRNRWWYFLITLQRLYLDLKTTSFITCRWVVLAEDPHYSVMHENIESLKCDCSPELGLPPRIGTPTKKPKIRPQRRVSRVVGGPFVGCQEEGRGAHYFADRENPDADSRGPNPEAA